MQTSFGFTQRTSAHSLAKGREIVIDLFCGGGGASTGIESATGYAVDEAINHSPEAIFYHSQNHPCTNHFRTDVFDVHPLAVSKGRPVGLLWLSPDCTHFSKSRGGAPKKKSIRSLATVGLWYARTVKPRVITLENVSEFKTWCRLDKRTQQPDMRKKGEYFHKFVRRLKQMGYAVEWRELTASDYGAPTSRTRLILIARCDGEKIVWPEKTHGSKPHQKPVRTASECIDFSLPTVSIFAEQSEIKEAGLRAKRPLADNTMERIGRGVWKFVIDNPNPFVIGIDNQSSSSAEWSIDEPVRTVTQKNRFALVMPFLAKHYTGVTGHGVERPIGTITGVDHHSLVSCHCEPANVDMVTSHLMSYHTQQGDESRCNSINAPLPTVDGSNRFAEVRTFLMKYYGNSTGQKIDEPLDTITGNDRFALVTVHGKPYRIVDIGLRMLTPDELLKAQFGDHAKTYKIDGMTKATAVHMIGNSVCPDLAEAVVGANYKPEKVEA